MYSVSTYIFSPEVGGGYNGKRLSIGLGINLTTAISNPLEKLCSYGILSTLVSLVPSYVLLATLASASSGTPKNVRYEKKYHLPASKGKPTKRSRK